MIQFLFTICLACIMMFTMCMDAFAATTKTGSISVTLTITDENLVFPNVSVSLYKIGSFSSKNGFELSKPYTETKIDLNEIKGATKLQKAAEQMVKVVKKEKVKAAVSTVTNGAGVAVFPNLKKGVYLVRQTGNEDVCIMSPAIISVPYSVNGGDWSYQVEAVPKVEKVATPTPNPNNPDNPNNPNTPDNPNKPNTPNNNNNSGNGGSNTNSGNGNGGSGSGSGSGSGNSGGAGTSDTGDTSVLMFGAAGIFAFACLFAGVALSVRRKRQ